MEEQVEHLAAPPSDGASAVLALIERAALDPGTGAAKLERIVAMYERVRAKEAELAFNAAKGRILKKLSSITIVKNRPALDEIEKGKPQKGTYEAFKYAPMEEIDKHPRPLLLEEEMDLSYSDGPREHGWTLIRGRLRHLPGGHFEQLVEGIELSPKVARMCAMNLYLHGISGDKVVVHTGLDSPAAEAEPRLRWRMLLAPLKERQ